MLRYRFDLVFLSRAQSHFGFGFVFFLLQSPAFKRPFIFLLLLRHRRLNSIIELMNFKMSPRPSLLTLEVLMMLGNLCHVSSSLFCKASMFSSTEGALFSSDHTL